MTATAPSVSVVPRLAVGTLRERDLHLLLWQARGGSRLTTGRTRWSLREGTALWVPAGSEHRFTVAQDSVLLPMFFSVVDAGPAIPGLGVVPVVGELEMLCLALVSSQYSLLGESPALRRQVLAHIRAHLSAPTGLRMPTSAAASRVASAVVENPADERTLAQWAAQLHVSTRSLERAFSAETGTGWRRWRHACRMHRAEELLDNCRTAVTDVADRVGFASPSAFARAFREHCGMTPTDYRSRPSRPVALRTTA